MNFSQILPKRKLDSHKGDYGHVLIVAGSLGYTGAAYLTAQSAIRTGSGLVTLAVPDSIYSILAIKLTEVMVRPFASTREGGFSKSALPGIQALADKVDAVAIGPGLSVHPQASRLVRELVAHLRKPIVLDADGLNAYENREKLLRKHNPSLILTPHPGEFGRLIHQSLDAIQAERVNLAKQYAEQWRAILVLKGHRTVAASPEGEIYENQTGNPGMATGGSGDLLTGIIASLIGQKVPPYSAACLGVYLHGLAGDLAAKEKGEHGLIAGDILDKIPEAIAGVAQG